MVLFLSACGGDEISTNTSKTNDFIKTVPNIKSAKKVQENSTKFCESIYRNSKIIEKQLSDQIDKVSLTNEKINKYHYSGCTVSFKTTKTTKLSVLFFNTQTEKITNSAFEELANTIDPKAEGRVNKREVQGSDNLSTHRLRKFENGIVMVKLTILDTSEENKNALANSILGFYI